MLRVFSAGGIVFKKDQNGLQFLLARNQSSVRINVDYWGFPKGHLEEGESSKQTALREVLEETGLETEIIEKVGQSKYIYTDPKNKPTSPDEVEASRGREKVFKVVTIFLMKYLSGEAKAQDSEISEVVWFPQDQVLDKLSFSEDKKLFQKAKEMLHE